MSGFIEGEDRHQASLALGLELYQLFDGIIQDRRANPRDDLASLLANGRIDGEYLPYKELISYYTIVATAGHVDHGKSSLVRALTGTDPDRLEEVAHPDALDELTHAFAVLAVLGPAHDLGELLRALLARSGALQPAPVGIPDLSVVR